MLLFFEIICQQNYLFLFILLKKINYMKIKNMHAVAFAKFKLYKILKYKFENQRKKIVSIKLYIYHLKVVVSKIGNN